MPNYQKGKIYTIRSLQCDKYYIGSTVQPLSKRLSKHKQNYNNWKKEKYHYISSFEMLKYDDCYIELLEYYPCNNKTELNKYEGQKQREFKNECININIAGRTKKEYYNENKDTKIKEYLEKNKEHIASRQCEYDKTEKRQLYFKEYRNNNKEKIKKRYEKNKEKYNKQKIQKINCQCGSIISKCNKSYHEKTKKHLKYIENLTKPSE